MHLAAAIQTNAVNGEKHPFYAKCLHACTFPSAQHVSRIRQRQLLR